jgi:tRNA threonylcarbamoyl adenosine modification protein (Sua5/YciO/YrdC/YwlC family)
MSQQFSTITDSGLIPLITIGAVGVIPTDTVYGLVARAADEAAIIRLYATKPRAILPGTIIAASVEDLAALGFSSEQLQAVAHFWPAPLSVVLDAGAIPHYLKQQRDSLAVRIPDSAALRELLQKTGPLMTTSANAPGQPTATTIEEACDYFGDAVDYYVDTGNLGVRPPSTIIGFDENGELIVHREGAVPSNTLLSQ